MVVRAIIGYESCDNRFGKRQKCDKSRRPTGEANNIFVLDLDFYKIDRWPHGIVTRGHSDAAVRGYLFISAGRDQPGTTSTEGLGGGAAIVCAVFEQKHYWNFILAF
jgi:hypothetical protein